MLENQAEMFELSLFILLIFLTYVVDNFLRIKSTTRLDYHISNISFDIHNFFLKDLKCQSKEERHATVQAIRNFADASINTMTLFKQPGIDSLVSLVSIPIILFFVDFKAFVLVIAYILIYYFVDHFTTQRYMKYRDVQDSKTENYYAKLQDSDDYDLEQKAFTIYFDHLTNWNFIEWFFLQNTAVIFNSIVLFYLIYSVVYGNFPVSHLVLVWGYVSQTHTHLNNFSSIKDSLSDMFIALEHLAKNKTVSALDLDDLI